MAENKISNGETPKQAINSVNMAKEELPITIKRKASFHIPMIYGNYVLINFGKVTKPVLIDTGASMSMVSLSLLNSIHSGLQSKILKSKTEVAKTVDGSKIYILGNIDLKLYLVDKKIQFNFQVIKAMEYWAILGIDFLRKYSCSIDYASDTLIVPNSVIKDSLVLGKPSIGVCYVNREANQGLVKPSQGTNRSLQVTKKDLIVTPQVLPKASKGQNVEICEAPKEAHDMAYYQKAAIPIFSNYEDEQMERPQKDQNKIFLPVPLDLSNTVFSESQKQKLRNLIKRYRTAFAVDDTELGRTHVYTHKLRLKPGAQPPRPKLYQTNATDREIIKKHLDDMLANDIIKPVSEGVFSSPTLLVPKKDGGLRYCADLREMNRILEEDVYPLPLIRDVIDALGTSQATIYSIVDLRSAFWQIRVHPASQKYLTINTHMGRFAFKVLPFGLHSSPSAFQRLMNTVLRGILWEFAIPFLDDIVIYSSDPEKHLLDLEEVFKRLTEAGLKLKPQKCQFGVSHIKYLGHNIGKRGIAPFADKVKAVKDFKTPCTMTQVKSFLGLANYYRKFVKDFSVIAKPLNDLTKKAKVFHWSEECQKAFMELKRRLVTAPVLAHGDPKLPYRLTTDASKVGLGWVLEQKQNDKFRVICYGGKSLTPAQTNYGISDLEALAVVTAIKDLDCYLRYQEFTILTDHQPLKYMLTNPSPPPGRWSRWIALLSPYKFTVEYLKGAVNKVADSLSRQKHKAVASEEDDLETYLCPLTAHKSNLPNNLSEGNFILNDPNKPLSSKKETKRQSRKAQVSKPNLETSHQVTLLNRENEARLDLEKAKKDLTKAKRGPCIPEQSSTEDPVRESEPTVLATQVKARKSFRRVKNWNKYKASKTDIFIGRSDPVTVSADCIFNFTTNQLKPVGPVSKSVQLAGGPQYRKSLQTSLNKNGLLNMGSVRRIEGGCTNVLWIYNINLPRFKLGKDVAPNTVYKVLTNALEIAAKSQIKKLIISPTDLVSLDFTSTKAVELISQVIWDYCHSDKIPFSEIYIPIQTLSMANKSGKIFQKFLKNSKYKVFEITKEPTLKQVRSKMLKTGRAVMDPQQLVQELNLSEGFAELDYDIDVKEIQKMQLKDDYFNLLIEYLKNDILPESEKIAKKIRKDSQNFELISGILYNFWIIPKNIPMERRARFRLCVPAELRHRLMYAYHDALLSAHRSAEKMYLLMKLNYFWKGMFADIQNWTLSCVRCSKSKALPKSRRAKLQPIMENRPFSMVNVDLIGPMEHSVEQYRYVLTMVDRATRYCFAVPIPDGTAVTIAKVIFSELISKFGLVDCIVSDRGLNFTSPIVQHLCSLIGTKRILTSAYRPSSNGLVESFNGVFKQKLLALTGEHPHNWPQYVDGVLYALRTTVVDSLGYSPFELLFGREPKLLLEVGPEILKTHPSISVRKYLADLRTQLNYVHDSAVEIETKQKQKMKAEYDKRSKPYDYQEGDRVWIRSPQGTPGSTKKFKDKYVGPYVLGKQTSQNNFKVRREDTNTVSDISLHSDRFKPCISRYVKPEYMPGVVDETITGPELPIELCNDDDFEESDKSQVELINTDQTPAKEIQKNTEIVKKSKEEISKLKKVTNGSNEVISKAKEVLTKAFEGLRTDGQNDLTTTNVLDEPSPSATVSEEYYPVDRIVRGKYTPEGIKYLIKWKGYSQKHNTWEKEDDLSPETLEDLKVKPVRIYGRKINGMQKEEKDDISPDITNKDEIIDLTTSEQALQEAYEAETDVDSDSTEDYD